jgi:UDP-N-acetylglucosamine--N-acetylmuramyl-(pentapeptide) pyrophosphoryl-undecaprenol N-acetylglucosamine transferase
MVPLPTAADDHQRRNAEALQNAGAVRMILQKDLTGKALANEIDKMVGSPDLIDAMEVAAKKLAKADAAEATVDIIEELANKNVSSR